MSAITTVTAPPALELSVQGETQQTNSPQKEEEPSHNIQQDQPPVQTTPRDVHGLRWTLVGMQFHPLSNKYLQLQKLIIE